MTGNRLKTARMPRDIGAARWRNDRGAVLILVTVMILGLLAFSAFSIDHGVMMVSRGQAQNAADAGAMAAALYLAYDGVGTNTAFGCCIAPSGTAPVSTATAAAGPPPAYGCGPATPHLE